MSCRSAYLKEQHSSLKQGQKCPLDTPERKRDSVGNTQWWLKHSDEGNTQWWGKHTVMTETQWWRKHIVMTETHNVDRNTQWWRIHTVITETHSDEGNTQGWRKHTVMTDTHWERENITRKGNKNYYKKLVIVNYDTNYDTGVSKTLPVLNNLKYSFTKLEMAFLCFRPLKVTKIITLLLSVQSEFI